MDPERGRSLCCRSAFLGTPGLCRGAGPGAGFVRRSGCRFSAAFGHAGAGEAGWTGKNPKSGGARAQIFGITASGAIHGRRSGPRRHSGDAGRPILGDSESDFKAALPSAPGPWLILTSGGADGAFGAGLLNGLTAGGKRPDYAVVTGVSTGALMAPFAFAGQHYDEALRKCYTEVTAADVFEAGTSTGESFVNSWPLREFIDKQITPELITDIAAAHRSGRRLFVVTSDLDSERSVVWNMGAIAAHGGEHAAKLFRSVLLASASIPGGFPPVLIDVEADGKRFQEMHVDGGLGGQFFVAPPSLMASTSDYRLPATQLYIIVNTGLQRDFKVVDRFAPTILTQSISMAVPVDTSLMIDRAFVVAKRSSVEFNVATIPASFNAPSRGPFDPNYMKTLFQVGFDQGNGSTAFAATPPPPPSGPTPQPSHIQKTGAN